MKITLSKINLPTSDRLVYAEAMEDIGLSAGICYMPDTYEALVNRGRERNIKTAGFATNNGHHSVADHVQVTFILEDCSKMVAMMLNSLGCYGTSEKSGRYTVMKNCSKLEKELYDKWLGKLKPLIMAQYSKVDEKYATKLAMENARLFLSVFAPSTTMKYTIGLKDANYIIDWCERFVEDTPLPDNYFYNTLKEELKWLGGNLEALIYVDKLRDHKGRKFNFLDSRNYDQVPKIIEFGEAYTTHYKMSFAGVAQEERHRTLVHKIFFDGVATDFYLPEILDSYDLIAEWLDDMKKVAHLIPQGTMVGVKEQGTLERFMLKCTERMCGRAQLEIMRQTVKTFDLYHMVLETKVVDENMGHYTEAYEKLSHLKPRVRCGFMQCKEPCIWGRKANERHI